MSLFTCPVCSGQLYREGKSYKCAAGHNYDISAQGYVNLLNANMKHSALPGDDAKMAAARRDFLARGYYEPLLKALCLASGKYANAEARVLDAGCGEGYYTAGIYQSLIKMGKTPQMYGTDISKLILKYAPKKERGVNYAVASSYRLPFLDGAFDLLINCFSPMAHGEFLRVLAPGGVFMYVVPSARHLWELKEILYSEPYENEEKKIFYEGFEYLEVIPVRSTAELTSKEDISNLFSMTPYFWKTPKEGVERLSAFDKLRITLGFDIHVYKKL